MKYIIFFFAITLFSCSKEPNEPSPLQGATGSIEYKVNGQSVVMNNVDLLSAQYTLFYKRIFNGNTWYELEAQKGANNVFSFSMLTDSLHKITYNYDTINRTPLPIVLSFNGELSSIFFSGDYFNVNITSYENSRISGTFTAKLTSETPMIDYSNRGTVLITEGKINNVQVIY